MKVKNENRLLFLIKYVLVVGIAYPLVCAFSNRRHLGFYLCGLLYSNLPTECVNCVKFHPHFSDIRFNYLCIDSWTLFTFLFVNYCIMLNTFLENIDERDNYLFSFHQFCAMDAILSISTVSWSICFLYQYNDSLTLKLILLSRAIIFDYFNLYYH